VLKIVYLVTAVVGLPCIIYLLLTPMEKDEFFLTRWLADRLFPKLDRRQRQQRLQFIAGFLLAVLLTAAAIAFLINKFGRG